MMRKSLSIFVVSILALSGCGSSHSSSSPALSKAVVDKVSSGHGSMGITRPANLTPKGIGPAAISGHPTYPDLSNNDPVYNMRAVKRAGHPAVVLKANQGTGFVDQTFLGQAKAAKSAGLAVGGYDFVSSYSVAEANLFVQRLHAAGIYRNTPNTLPPTLDIEYGGGNTYGIQAMVNVLYREYGRVNIYTGSWYWEPHFGCFWPSHSVTSWQSGYPYARKLCGTPSSLYTQHQYTDAGFNGVFNSDMSVYLGGDFYNKFVNVRQKPHVDPKQRDHRHLLALKVERRNIRIHLVNSGCRVKRPRNACKPLFRFGHLVNVEIKLLRSRGVR